MKSTLPAAVGSEQASKKRSAPKVRPVQRKVKDSAKTDAQFWDDALDGRSATVLNSLIDGFNPSMCRRIMWRGEFSEVPLIIAVCSKNDARMAGLLLQYGGKDLCIVAEESDGETALICSARLGHLACVEAVLGSLRMNFPQDELYQFIDVRDSTPCEATALLSASAALHVECVSALIRAGADTSATDSANSSALHLAAQTASACRMESLSGSSGSDDAAGRAANHLVHLFCEPGHLDLSSRNEYLETPLHLACVGGVWTLISTVLSIEATKSTADFDSSSDDDSTAHSHHQSPQRQEDGIKPHRLDIKNKRGLTPLHLCCFGNHIQGARLLLDAGFDITAITLSLQTPLQLAARAVEGRGSTPGDTLHQDREKAARQWIDLFNKAQRVREEREREMEEWSRTRRRARISYRCRQAAAAAAALEGSSPGDGSAGAGIATAGGGKEDDARDDDTSSGLVILPRVDGEHHGGAGGQQRLPLL